MQLHLIDKRPQTLRITIITSASYQSDCNFTLNETVMATCRNEGGSGKRHEGSEKNELRFISQIRLPIIMNK